MLKRAASLVLLLSLLGAGLQDQEPPVLGIPLPTASPSAGSLPEIYHTKTTAKCDTLRHVTLPVGMVTKRNDEAFHSMARSLVTFLHGIYPSDVPTFNDFAAAAQAPQGEGTTPITASMGDANEDDPLLYGAGQVLTAARIDDVAHQVFQNLVLEQKYIDKAQKEDPNPTDPNVAQMRRRAQNLIDLQRVLANAYEEFAGTFLDNQGVAGLSHGNQTMLKLRIRQLLLGEAGALTSNYQGYSTTQQDPQYIAHYGNPGDVMTSLESEEELFGPETLHAYNDCNGTKFVLVTPTPSPSPTP